MPSKSLFALAAFNLVRKGGAVCFGSINLLREMICQDHSSSSSYSTYLHLRQKTMAQYLKTNQHLFCKFLRRTYTLIYKSLKKGKRDKSGSQLDRSCDG